MSKYIYRVQLEGNDGFLLDVDRLDIGLLGYLTEDVSSYVRSVSTRRGKSTIQGKFTAGQMTVIFDNRDRAFDPNYAASPYYGSIVPRRKLIFQIGADPDNTGEPFWGDVFHGFIDDWSFDYDVSGDSTATASCSDAFGILANQNVTLTTPIAELTENRIGRVLSSTSVAWPIDKYGYGFSTFTMGTASYSGNALDYLQTVAESEAGYFFANNAGALTYYGWNYFSYGLFKYPFSDNPGSTAIPFTNIEVSYGTDELYNLVTVQSYAGTVTAQDVASQQAYRIAEGTFDVATAGTAQMTTLANYYISNYGTPRLRVSSITCSLDDPVIQNTMSLGGGSIGYGAAELGRFDIGLPVEVNWTPNGIGSAVTQTGFIIGVSLNATPERCNITYSISGNDIRASI